MNYSELTQRAKMNAIPAVRKARLEYLREMVTEFAEFLIKEQFRELIKDIKVTANGIEKGEVHLEIVNLVLNPSPIVDNPDDMPILYELSTYGELEVRIYQENGETATMFELKKTPSHIEELGKVTISKMIASEIADFEMALESKRKELFEYMDQLEFMLASDVLGDHVEFLAKTEFEFDENGNITGEK